MEYETDVLIIGCGPTGLMLASQLLRFGIAFRIIDKEADRAHESRAFGIQAKSMEIFQNLGIVSEFLKYANTAKKAHFYFENKLNFEITTNDLNVDDSPFPKVFLLPQSCTEQIFLKHLEKFQITVERQKQLISFNQLTEGVEANVKNNLTDEYEKIRCRFIVGCDGARSSVRNILKIPFVGADYTQEFVLADVTVNWKYPKDELSIFINKNALLAYIPMREKLSRLIISGMKIIQLSEIPKLEEIERFIKEIMNISIKLENPIWVTRFHLHHRAVERYQQGRAFLAGDAAHIHSPVAGQGMNTGLQDATNLAWKLALFLKYSAPLDLLTTYQTERQRIGAVLLKTTDRVFNWFTGDKFRFILMRQYLMPFFMRFAIKSKKFRRRIFCFASELGIHYHPNPIIWEVRDNADKKFILGPKAGYRAPDAPIDNSTLFVVFREKPCTILVFQPQATLTNEQAEAIAKLRENCPDVISVHQFIPTKTTKILFDRYGVTKSVIYFIRPDGYIGFRVYGCRFAELFQYLRKLFPE